MDFDFGAHLAARGSQLLGAGGFSAVVADPGDPASAIKIGLSTHDGWPVWARWSRENPDPHVPAVHSLRWLRSRAGLRLFFVAEMERLEPADEPRAWMRDAPHRKRDPLALAAFLEREHPAIAALLRQARAAFPAGTFDMGVRNWMVRPSTGDLVLTDPLSWRARVGSTDLIEF